MGGPGFDALYAALAARRVAHDQGIWTTPPLVVAIVSFTVAPMADWISSTSHEQAALGMLVCALAAFAVWASIRLIARHRQAETRDAMWLDLLEHAGPLCENSSGLGALRAHSWSILRDGMRPVQNADGAWKCVPHGQAQPNVYAVLCVGLLGLVAGVITARDAFSLGRCSAVALGLVPLLAAWAGWRALQPPQLPVCLDERTGVPTAPVRNCPCGCTGASEGVLSTSCLGGEDASSPLGAFHAWILVLWAYFAALCIGVGYFGATAVAADDHSNQASCAAAELSARSALEAVSQHCAAHVDE